MRKSKFMPNKLLSLWPDIVNHSLVGVLFQRKKVSTKKIIKFYCRSKCFAENNNLNFLIISKKKKELTLIIVVLRCNSNYQKKIIFCKLLYVISYNDCVEVHVQL